MVTADKMIFRVYGYYHPPHAYVCDPEYAPDTVFKSENPRAFRTNAEQVYYKFFADEGLRFVRQRLPKYMVWYEPLQTNVVGVKQRQIAETRQPNKAFQSMLLNEPTDDLLKAMHALFEQLKQRTNLSEKDFGVFGSLLHKFYHPQLSDLDLIIYGKAQLNKLRETLSELYHESGTPLTNEFDSTRSAKDKHWKFQNYSLKEYVWHQRRKQIYAVFHPEGSGRTIKVEFEPVKRWEEIENEYNSSTRITQEGWTKLVAKITEDGDAAFIPSIYHIVPTEIIRGKHVDNIKRIISFVEEFRMQTQKDEIVLVEGNLERVETRKQTFHQVTLTYGQKYYEQTLKVLTQAES
jgi:predicted nucleotidyltransferase